MNHKKILIEVAYALPDRQQIVSLTVAEGTTVYDAVLQSGILDQFPQIDPDNDKMGIFAKAVREPKKTILQSGDRIEIYRPLLIDPKQARLNRAAKNNAKSTHSH